MERYTLPSAPPPTTTVHNTHTVIPWTMEPPHAEDIAETAASWTTPISEPKHHPLLPFFKPEPDYYYYYDNNNNSSSITSTTSDNSVVVPFVSNSNPTTTTHNNNNFLMHQNTNNNMDSFPLESQPHPFFNNYSNNNPFETGFESGFFSTVNLMGLSSATELLFPPPSLELGGGASFDAPLVAQQQPTLFQKRRGTLEIPRLETGKKIKNVGVGVVDDVDVDVDGSGLNLYDSDENENENENENGSGLNNNQNGNGGGGDHRGKKKKGLPAKNLMAERRRRKKLNDRLYMLRSVVPKISKMDRASILGDAVDYLKELLQRINDLHNELESTPPGSLLPPPSASFHPLTPTPPTLPCRVKEDLYPGSLQSPKNQPAKVEVRVREGRAVNIHMFCSRRPGLLLSTMRALDNLGLDVQQAVISCFNGFALDVFRAEQCREGQDVLPEQIKAVLLDSAGFHGMT